MFGVNLKMKYPFYAGMVGSAIASAYMTITNVISVSPSAAGVIGFVCIKPEYILHYLIGVVIAAISAFVVTIVLSKLDRFKNA